MLLYITLTITVSSGCSSEEA